MHIHKNIKFLRLRKKATQAEAAVASGLSRSQWAGYETHVKPTLEALIALSKYFNISTDVLLKMDLTILLELEIRQLETSPAAHQEAWIKGSKMRVLATTVSLENRDLTEVVPVKAKAGYLNGYADPDYVAQLPMADLSFALSGAKHRIFQIEGDSMLPYESNAYIACSFVEDWHHVKDGRKYVFLTEDEGVVFKIAYNRIAGSGSLLLSSSNPLFPPFEVPVSAIREVWRFEVLISK